MIDENLKTILMNEVISKSYPKLIISHKELLLKNLLKIINLLSLIYNFNKDKPKFFHELMQNNFQAPRWITSMLFEYTSTPENITSFHDFYKAKTEHVNVKDLDKIVAPKYTFTNVQFSRINRDTLLETEFNEEFIEHNTQLFMLSIQESAHKFYVNWMDILPISLLEYKSTDLYNNTNEIMKNNNLKELDVLDSSITVKENTEYFHALQISDIYNVIRNFLYEDIKSTKMFIYDLIDSKYKKLISGIYFYDRYFAHSFKRALNNITWLNLEPEYKETFQLQLAKLFNASLTKSQIEFTVDNVESIFTAQSIQRIVMALIITFDNKNKLNKRVLKSGYRPIKTNIIG